MPDYQLETDLIAAGHKRIAGVDEVGRGPLAGPVTAAAAAIAGLTRCVRPPKP